jgi:hypothetical protein
MATKQELRKRLDELASEADKQTRLQDSATRMLYRGLAELYVWWKEASAYEGFLDELYDEFNIRTRNQGEENFVRVIRLMWRIDWSGRRSPSLQKWSQALRKVHHEVETNRNKYKANTIENIILFIQASGGVNGLIGITQDLANKQDIEVGAKNKNKTKQTREQENALVLNARHLELAEKYFANDAKPIVKLDLGEQPIVTNDKSYALALVRKTAESKYQILSVTENDALITEAMIRTYKRQQDSAPKTLRLISEVIQTQALPIAFEKHRQSLAPKSKVLNEQKKPMRQIKRLLYRAKTKDFLLSENRTDCAVVTIAKPFDFTFKTQSDTFLNANDRTYIEQQIVQSKNLSFFDIASGKEILENEDDEVKATHFIMSKYKIDGYVRNLYFYSLDTLAEQSKQQADFNPTASAPLWEAEVDAAWISTFNANFLSHWLRTFGASVNQRRNQLLRVDLTKSSLVIHYDGVGTHLDKQSQGLMNPIIKKFKKNLKLNFLSKDLIPTMNALTEQAIVGRVKLIANEDALGIIYKTEIAQYYVAVPTSNSTGRRNKAAFVGYGVAHVN